MSNQYPPSGNDPEGQDPASPGDQPPAPPQWGGGGGGSSSPYGDQPGNYPPGNYPPGNYPPGAGGPGGYAGAPKTSPLAIVALVTGIIAVIPCCWSLPVFAIAAAATGFLGRKQIDQSQGQLKGRGMATAGLVLGIIGIVIAIVYWILYAAGTFDSFMNYDFSTN